MFKVIGGKPTAAELRSVARKLQGNIIRSDPLIHKRFRDRVCNVDVAPDLALFINCDIPPINQSDWSWKCSKYQGTI